MRSHIEFGWFKSIFIIIPKSNVTHAFLIYSLYIYIQWSPVITKDLGG